MPLLMSFVRYFFRNRIGQSTFKNEGRTLIPGLPTIVALLNYAQFWRLCPF